MRRVSNNRTCIYIVSLRANGGNDDTHPAVTPGALCWKKGIQATSTSLLLLPPWRSVVVLTTMMSVRVPTPEIVIGQARAAPPSPFPDLQLRPTCTASMPRLLCFAGGGSARFAASFLPLSYSYALQQGLPAFMATDTSHSFILHHAITTLLNRRRSISFSSGKLDQGNDTARPKAAE
jgi:hypothetical protein